MYMLGIPQPFGTCVCDDEPDMRIEDTESIKKVFGTYPAPLE